MGVIEEKVAIGNHIATEDTQHGEVYDADEEVLVGW